MAVNQTMVDKKEKLRNFEKIMGPARGLLDQLNSLLLAQVNEFEPEVRELVRYVVSQRGKQFRPMLVFYSGWSEDEQVRKDLVKAAAVVELIHMATLVHDDILDGALMRHNSETLGVRYGSKQSVLLGDALFAHALKLASEFPTSDVCRLVSESTRKVCAGEIAQTFLEGEEVIPEKEYYRIIDLKTAELFSVSSTLGGLLGRYSSEYVEAVGRHGRALGMAFQIYDDMVDLLGNEEVVGKTLGTDFLTGKFTLPLLLLFSKVDRKQIDISDLEDLMVTYRISDKVKDAMGAQIQKAQIALRSYVDKPSFSYLSDLEGVMVGLMAAL